MERPEGLVPDLAPGEPARPASGELFAGHEVAAFESFLDNLATENEFLFHPKVPASLSWNGFHTTKNQGFDEFKHSGLQFGSDKHFSPTNGYIARHKFVPVGYGHVHPQSSAQRSQRSSTSSRTPSRRPSIYDVPGGESPASYAYSPVIPQMSVQEPREPAAMHDDSVASGDRFRTPLRMQADEKAMVVNNRDTASPIFGTPGASSDLDPDSSLSKKIKIEEGAGKQPLTAAQKRQNHISSEQRRRNLIKEGFNELSNIVPNVVGNASKSTILNEAIIYIKANEKRNQGLREKLETLRSGVNQA